MRLLLPCGSLKMYPLLVNASALNLTSREECLFLVYANMYTHCFIRFHNNGFLCTGPWAPAMVMEFLPNGDLKTFLTVSWYLREGES